jgi:hypothetical protein
MRAKVTTHVLLGCKKPRLPCRGTCSGRNDLGGEQTRRPEHNEIAAASKADWTAKLWSKLLTKEVVHENMTVATG